jgi:hypothetical protein
MSYTINIADDDTKNNVYEWIEKHESIEISEFPLGMSNKYLSECLIVFECLKNLKLKSYALVSSNGYGYSTHYLYKLDDESIIVVNSGIDGIIHNIKKINPNFESNLKIVLNFLNVNWSIYQSEKKDFEEKRIDPVCKFYE